MFLYCVCVFTHLKFRDFLIKYAENVNLQCDQ